MKTVQPTPSLHAVAHGTTIGIDLRAARLGLPAEPVGTSHRFANHARGRLALRSCVRRLGSSRVALEPTGRCHEPLHQCLATSNTVATPVRAGERVFQRRTAGPAYDR